MTSGTLGDLNSQAGEKGVRADDQRTRTPLHHHLKGAIEVTFLPHTYHDNLHAEVTCGIPNVPGLILSIGIIRVDQECDQRGGGHHLVHEPEALGAQPGREYANAAEITARSIEAGDEAGFHRVVASREDDRNRRGRRLGGLCRDGASCRGKYRHAPADEFREEGWQSIKLVESVAIFDRDVLALDKPQFTETTTKRRHELGRVFGRCDPDKTHHRNRLFRTRHERPRRCAPNQRDELAPPHSITSSATARSPDGTSMPSARAV